MVKYDFEIEGLDGLSGLEELGRLRFRLNFQKIGKAFKGALRTVGRFYKTLGKSVIKIGKIVAPLAIGLVAPVGVAGIAATLLTKGIKLAKAGQNITGLLEKGKKVGLKPDMLHKIITRSMKENKPIKIFTPNTLKAAVNEKIKNVIEKAKTEKKAISNFYTLFNPKEPVLQGLGKGYEADKKSKLKVEKEKLLKNLKNLFYNIKIVQKKLGAGIFRRTIVKHKDLDRQLTNQTKNILNRAKAIKKELRGYSNLTGEIEPFLVISAAKGIEILTKYNEEIIQLANEIKRINKVIDDWVSNKLPKEMIPQPIYTPKKAGLFSLETIIPLSLIGLGVFFIPKIIAKKKGQKK
mgnify:CR=1 FL=1